MMFISKELDHGYEVTHYENDTKRICDNKGDYYASYGLDETWRIYKGNVVKIFNCTTYSEIVNELHRLNSA